MESPVHLALKAAATRWLRAIGCCASAIEVPCPLSRWRIDAAGYMDVDPRRREVPSQSEDDVGDKGATHKDAAAPSLPAPLTPPPWLLCPTKALEPTTLVIECKVSRNDFLRDACHADKLIARRAELQAELQVLEREYIQVGQPHLRRSGTYLFSDMEPWDMDAAASPLRPGLLRELRRLDAAIHGHTKFFMLARYRLATHLLVLAAPGVVEDHEVPPGWGLLQIDNADEERGCQTLTSPPTLVPHLRARHRLLRNIASVLTSRSMTQDGEPRQSRTGVASTPWIPAMVATETAKTEVPSLDIASNEGYQHLQV